MYPGDCWEEHGHGPRDKFSAGVGPGVRCPAQLLGRQVQPSLPLPEARNGKLLQIISSSQLFSISNSTSRKQDW